MKKGLLFTVPKLIIGLIIFITVILFLINKTIEGSTAAESANEILKTNLFTQSCLELGAENYFCITPDNDKITTITNPEDLLADTRWDGCPSGLADDYPYITPHTDCESKVLLEGVEQVAYCCSKVQPKQCEILGLRTCETKYRNEREVSDGIDCIGKFEDSCVKNCGILEEGTSYSACSKYIPSTGRAGGLCLNNPGCCGKTDDRRCEYDCSTEYPTYIEKPEIIDGDIWGCQINENTACCQK